MLPRAFLDEDGVSVDSCGRLMEKVGDVSAGAIGEHVVFVEENDGI